MSTLVILATTDAALADAWERQLPTGRTALKLSGVQLPNGSSLGFAAVVVLDAVLDRSLPSSLERCPTIYVGEPRTLPFEQARLSGRAKFFLSYEESATRLRELLPLVEELAEKQSLIELLSEKTRRVAPGRIAGRVIEAEAAELWDFLEGAVENLDSRERLVAEFRRASRHVLRASHAVFFLRDAEGFRADRGAASFAANDPMVAFFEAHPILIDGTNWEYPSEPVAELAVRNRFALWGARMLVPVHDNGRLLGLIALGVRDDGKPYDEVDRARVVFFARLLRYLLVKSSQIMRLEDLAKQTSLGAKYLPGSLVIGPDEAPPRHLPVAVRDVIGRARLTREICRAVPIEGQPYRASAGPIPETGGLWAHWQEASAELQETGEQRRAARRELLRELGLTLNHELGNALVSLATFRFSSPEQPLPPAIFEAAKHDIAKLETLNTYIAMMPSLNEADAAPADVREIAQRVGGAIGLRVEVGPDPIILVINSKLLEFGLRALVKAVTENRVDLGAKELTLSVRSTGAGAELTALLALRGKTLELEGILPEPVEGAVPNQGRLGVFLAREILRLHHGEIHAGPGMEGTEIQISVRKW